MRNLLRRSLVSILTLAAVVCLALTFASFFSSHSITIQRQNSFIPSARAFEDAARTFDPPRSEWLFSGDEAAAGRLRTYVRDATVVRIGNGGLAVRLFREPSRMTELHDQSPRVRWSLDRSTASPQYPRIGSYRSNQRKQLLYSMLGASTWRGPYEPDAVAYGGEFAVPLLIPAIAFGIYPLIVLRRWRASASGVGFPVDVIPSAEGARDR